VGCVPSKALLRAAKAIAEVRRCAEFGVVLPAGDVAVDFAQIMARLRAKRVEISPADGHAGTTATGAHVFQGRGKFISPTEIEVGGTVLRFKKAVIATGGRPTVPPVPGLADAPYTTNETLFNLQQLPPRMVFLGAGVIALEMAQCFATFGAHVTVVQRSNMLFESKQGDPEASKILQEELEKSGVHFLTGKTKEVITLKQAPENKEFPLMKVVVEKEGADIELECECIMVATGRVANVENLGLEEAGVQYKLGEGILVDDLAKSISNPNVYGVGDCVAGVPRLTHASGEMAKLVVQNSLFDDSWKISSLVIPSVMYTEPECATVGIYSAELAARQGILVDVYRGGLEHNDRAILESTNVGFVKVICRQGTDEILGATIVAERAGEMVNEISLAMKHQVGLYGIGRNVHAYPTTGEAVMGAGIQYINSHWARLD
jgi:pyruvate/2-oxoglutarate dehydrogenase complex dihydrolipoamide dehydrogenase (E3) component